MQLTHLPVAVAPWFTLPKYMYVTYASQGCVACLAATCGAGRGAKDEESYGHAVVLIGYNNNLRFWIVRSSWGPKVGTQGYFKVAYGASGVADLSNTWGLRFAPLKPTPAYSASQITLAAKKGCYNYKAVDGDYFSTVADKFAVPVKQLALDNLMTHRVTDPTALLAGCTVLVCNAKEVADVLPPTSQVGALLRIKAAIDPNNLLTSWRVGPESKPHAYCTWAGIICDAKNNVVGIAIVNGAVGDKKLAGVLPSTEALLALPKLLQFSIFTQDLVGKLPESYARLTQLTKLGLTGNKLRGTLPAAWAAMKKLSELNLGSYNFDGEGMQGNLLVGTLPKQWGALSNLRVLTICQNQLTGPLPPSWGELRLEMLQLANNQLTGSVPGSWAKVFTQRLDEVVLTGNRLSGTLPPNW